jgi:sec-independent protein translocase protein TatA
MMGIGFPELMIILVIIMIIFGAGKLPEIGSAFGNSIKNFKKSMKEAEEIQEATNLESTESTETSEASDGSEPSEGETTKEPAPVADAKEN